MSETFSHQKEEYLSLRKEIENALADMSNLERNCLLAISAVYVWLVSKSQLPPPDRQIAWSVPVLLGCFSALRAYSINRHFGVMSSYIQGIEKMNKPGGDKIGWETFFAQPGMSIQTTVRMGFWGVLILLTVVIAFLKGW